MTYLINKNWFSATPKNLIKVEVADALNESSRKTRIVSLFPQSDTPFEIYKQKIGKLEYIAHKIFSIFVIIAKSITPFKVCRLRWEERLQELSEGYWIVYKKAALPVTLELVQKPVQAKDNATNTPDPFQLALSTTPESVNPAANEDEWHNSKFEDYEDTSLTLADRLASSRKLNTARKPLTLDEAERLIDAYYDIGEAASREEDATVLQDEATMIVATSAPTAAEELNARTALATAVTSAATSAVAAPASPVELPPLAVASPATIVINGVTIDTADDFLRATRGLKTVGEMLSAFENLRSLNPQQAGLIEERSAFASSLLLKKLPRIYADELLSKLGVSEASSASKGFFNYLKICIALQNIDEIDIPRSFNISFEECFISSLAIDANKHLHIQSILSPLELGLKEAVKFLKEHFQQKDSKGNSIENVFVDGAQASFTLDEFENPLILRLVKDGKELIKDTELTAEGLKILLSLIKPSFDLNGTKISLPDPISSQSKISLESMRAYFYDKGLSAAEKARLIELEFTKLGLSVSAEFVAYRIINASIDIADLRKKAAGRPAIHPITRALSAPLLEIVFRGLQVSGSATPFFIPSTIFNIPLAFQLIVNFAFARKSLYTVSTTDGLQEILKTPHLFMRFAHLMGDTLPKFLETGSAASPSPLSLILENDLLIPTLLLLALSNSEFQIESALAFTQADASGKVILNGAAQTFMIEMLKILRDNLFSITEATTFTKGTISLHQANLKVFKEVAMHPKWQEFLSSKDLTKIAAFAAIFKDPGAKAAFLA